MGRLAVAAVVLASLVAGCGVDDARPGGEPDTSAPSDADPDDEADLGDADGQDADEAEPDAPSAEADPDAPATGEIDPQLQPLVDAAVADLAERLEVDGDQITPLVAEMVLWSDPSLGCPQPGMRYRQVPQDGARVQLEHEGRTYDYHAGGDRPDPFLCEPQLRDPGGAPREDGPDVPPPGGDIGI